MSMQAPLSQTLEVNLPGSATAADEEYLIGEAPYDGVVTDVTYTPDALITGVATNTRAIRVRNKGQAGAGAVVVAELQFDSGVNATAFDEKVIPLSGTPANLAVVAGDILAAFTEAVGTGLADPGGRLAVTIARS